MDPDRLARWAAQQECPKCHNRGLIVEWRYRAKKIGSYSVAGQSLKVVATRVPWIKCPACGVEAEGKGVLADG